jgi:chaperonin cofactor prefoldin
MEGTTPRQKTKEELEDRIDALEAENETLQDQIDSIQDIIEPEEDDDQGSS